MRMNERKSEVLNKWLSIELYYQAKKAGFITQEADYADEKLIGDTIRCLDHETHMIDNPNVNLVITLIALMWEHIDHDTYDLRHIILKFLSRLRYPTSAIITDDGYDSSSCSFTEMPSLIDEIIATINQSLVEVDIRGNKYLLTDYQKRIWDSMDSNRIIGISAPTSAGKSFVILLKLISRLAVERIDVVYIVPTISLLNQVTEDFNRELKRNGIKDCYLSNSFNPEKQGMGNRVYVLTQEKAIAAFSYGDQAFSSKLILVVDEIQNLERVQEDLDERSKVLYDTLMEFRYKPNVDQVLISGPRISNIKKAGEAVFGTETVEISTDISPVLNLTYSIEKRRGRYYFKQYCSLSPNPKEVEIERPDSIIGYGKKEYSEEYLDFLINIVRVLGKDNQNIVFAPTSKAARKIALHESTRTETADPELIAYYRETIHSKYSLCDALENNIAYHHGKLPMHVRRTLEHAISTKKVRNVVCTTTLLQGVNLPAQNIFIRNPHLYIRKTSGSVELTNYEMANLRGRAGRLLKDFIGRTFVLDESEFENTDSHEQMDLFSEEKKEIYPTYEDRYKENKTSIQNKLIDNEPVDDNDVSYGYLVSYIRQTVLKYGYESQKRMENVGIKLTQKQVAAIIQKMGELQVPREICLRNRYWDPVILEAIYKKFRGTVPSSPKERGAKYKVDNILRFLRDTEETSVMYNKYIPSSYQNGKKRSIMTGLSIQWSQGVPLNEILSSDRYIGEEGADNIEDTIELLQNTVSYSLPLLLKPVFDVVDMENSFLSCMQVGACDSITKSMIELGLARETAIYLSMKINMSEVLLPKDNSLEEFIRDQIKKVYSTLPYWIRIQLDFLI